MQVPLFILEEHNESLLVWSYALKSNITQSNVRLLHFDDHADLRRPILSTSVNGLLEKIDEIKDFIYKEIKIDTFIVPA